VMLNGSTSNIVKRLFRFAASWCIVATVLVRPRGKGGTDDQLICEFVQEWGGGRF